MTQILEYINDHPKEIKIVIGITNEQFEKLVGNAQKLQLKKRQGIPSQEKRLIKAGGGRKKSLKVEEEIILTLYCLHP